MAQKKKWKPVLFADVDLDAARIEAEDPWGQGFRVVVNHGKGDRVATWEAKNLPSSEKVFALAALEERVAWKEKTGEEPKDGDALFLQLVMHRIEEMRRLTLKQRRKRAVEVLVHRIWHHDRVLSRSDLEWVLVSHDDILPEGLPFGGQSVGTAVLSWIESVADRASAVVEAVEEDDKKKSSATDDSRPDTSAPDPGPSVGESTTASKPRSADAERDGERTDASSAPG